MVQPIGNALLGTSGQRHRRAEGRGRRDHHHADRARPAAAHQQCDRRRHRDGAPPRRRHGHDRAQHRPRRAPAASSCRCRACRIPPQLKELIGETARLSFHEVHPTACRPRRPSRAGCRPASRSTRAARRDEGAPAAARDAGGARRRAGRLAAGLRPADQRADHQLPLQQLGRAQVRHVHQGQRRPAVRHRARRQGDLGARDPRARSCGGSGQISGSFTVETANKLAIQLRSGALPAKLTIVEERTVGPSLGADSIEAGKLAGIIGGIATIVLTVLAYGTFGIFAVRRPDRARPADGRPDDGRWARR